MFPIVDSHNELHEKDILWTEENLQTSNAFGAESNIESHGSRQLPNEPPKKRSRTVSLVSVRKSRRGRWLICAITLKFGLIGSHDYDVLILM